MPGAWLVLPTYNEAENIERVRARRAAAARRGRARAHVLIVDDNSPDGTGADRRPARRRAPARWRCSTAPRKEGLGRAYLAGFGSALASGAELVLEMDSDFSHDPADLPRLIAAADAARTSCSARATSPGGGVTDWGLVRRRSQPRRLAGTRASCSACPSRPHRRLQVLPPRGARGDRPRRHARRRLRLPDRADLPRDPGRDSGCMEVPIMFRDRRAGSRR